MANPTSETTSFPSTEPIIGIDLGTTNSLVAFCDERGPRILIPSHSTADSTAESATPEGEDSLPSVVRLSLADSSLEDIGHSARAQAITHPTNTIHSVKRLMGRALADIADEAATLPYPVVEGPQNTARIQVGNNIISPQHISALILTELKSRAEAALQTPVKKAVITVPAYFDDAQRQATRDAARIAGLQVVRIVNEPTAAALAYGLSAPVPKSSHKTSGGISLSTKINPEACSTPESPSSSGSEKQAQNEQIIAVYDLGGGTFDISILRLTQTDTGSVDQVLATAGDTHLGGDDVDNLLINLIQSEIAVQFFDGKSIDFPPSTRQAFRNFAEQTKIRLSNDEIANIEIAIGGGKTYTRSITREEFESLISPWADKTITACQAVLHAANLTPADIERVIMVGGSTRIPLIRQHVGDFFNTTPYTALDPDKVVALGAAVQASILMGISSSRLLLDVIPLSLGIETMGDAVAKLITANTTIPTRATEIFSTYVDGQTNVKIHILQGERELVKDCRSLGQFELRNIPPMPAGLPKIEVTFLVDANGILSVSATEARSGKRAAIQIIPNHGLTSEEITQIETEAFQHAREDMNVHRLIDLRLNAKLDIRNINKQLDRVADEIDPTYRAEIESHVKTVQSFIDANNPDADAFQKAHTDMDHATIKLAELNIAKTLRDEGLASQ
ncbi:Hsp70 family protein [Poriferisphaera sp. WC338]|uniref:Hsp70 family protein n=1 Tax=Poriferisphaera sp. WC338 TaxID=3425129 RepID=UPI003D813D08